MSGFQVSIAEVAQAANAVDDATQLVQRIEPMSVGRRAAMGIPGGTAAAAVNECVAQWDRLRRHWLTTAEGFGEGLTQAREGYLRCDAQSEALLAESGAELGGPFEASSPLSGPGTSPGYSSGLNMPSSPVRGVVR